MADEKWSAFPTGGAIEPNDILVGLRGGVNYQFSAPGSAFVEWAANANAAISATVGNGYILTYAGSSIVTLPTTFAVGSMIGVAGEGGAWTIDIGALTNIEMFGNTYTTSIASANTTDSIVLLATVANTTWVPIYMLTSGFTAS